MFLLTGALETGPASRQTDGSGAKVKKAMMKGGKAERVQQNMQLSKMQLWK